MSSFFGREGGRWGVSSFFGGKIPPPFFRPIFDPFFGPKIEDGDLFDLRLRKSKIEDRGSSIFGSENRKWGFFDLRLRRTKKEEFFEEGGFFEEGAVLRRRERDLRRTEGRFFEEGEGNYSKKGRVFEERALRRRTISLKMQEFFEEGESSSKKVGSFFKEEGS